jgi:predicted RNA-binding protein YlqC (UPF0109 family)
MEHQDQAFLEMIIKLIVTVPGEVEITRTVDDLGVLITLKVSKEDMGRVIGKDGQTAKAIRTLLRAIGSRNNIRVNMKILEPEGSEMGMDAPAAQAPTETTSMEESAPAEAPVEEAAQAAEGDIQFDTPADESTEAPEGAKEEEAPVDRPMPGDDIDI